MNGLECVPAWEPQASQIQTENKALWLEPHVSVPTFGGQKLTAGRGLPPRGETLGFQRCRASVVLPGPSSLTEKSLGHLMWLRSTSQGSHDSGFTMLLVDPYHLSSTFRHVQVHL